MQTAIEASGYKIKIRPLNRPWIWGDDWLDKARARAPEGYASFKEELQIDLLARFQRRLLIAAAADSTPADVPETLLKLAKTIGMLEEIFVLRGQEDIIPREYKSTLELMEGLVEAVDTPLNWNEWQEECLRAALRWSVYWDLGLMAEMFPDAALAEDFSQSGSFWVQGHSGQLAPKVRKYIDELCVAAAVEEPVLVRRLKYPNATTKQLELYPKLAPEEGD